MAVRKITYGTRTAFSLNSNVTSLASNAAKPLGEVDNTSTLAIDYHFYLEISLAASSVSATGTIEVYLLEGSLTGSGETTDGISMGATTDQLANIKNARMIACLAANANSQIVRFNARLCDYVAYPANFFTLLIYNRSGTALLGSGHDTKYVPITETIA